MSSGKELFSLSINYRWSSFLRPLRVGTGQHPGNKKKDCSSEIIPNCKKLLVFLPSLILLVYRYVFSRILKWDIPILLDNLEFIQSFRCRPFCRYYRLPMPRPRVHLVMERFSWNVETWPLSDFHVFRQDIRFFDRWWTDKLALQRCWLECRQSRTSVTVELGSPEWVCKSWLGNYTTITFCEMELWYAQSICF